MTKLKDSKLLERPELPAQEKAPDDWRHSHPSPSVPVAFDIIADSEHQYWLHQTHDDPEKGPKASTIEARGQRLARIKAFFGNQPIHTINTERAALFYDSITSTHEYQKMRYIVSSIFNFARAKGKFPDHLVNPGEAAQLRRIPRDTVRRTMEPSQYKAIHQRAPEWIQIAMEIILQTSLRQEDVWQLRWDNIVDNALHVIPNKSKTSRRKNKGYSYLKFDLKKKCPHSTVFVSSAYSTFNGPAPTKNS